MQRQHGLYKPENTKGSCGLGFVANINGTKSRKVIEDGLKILENIEHRGATGADPLVGDGAGILCQIPQKFFENVVDFELPKEGEWAIGQYYMPKDAKLRSKMCKSMEQIIEKHGFKVLGWRDTPTDDSTLSKDKDFVSRVPHNKQVFVKRKNGMSQDQFEQQLYMLRRVVSNTLIKNLGVFDDCVPVSLSCRTIIYKGMFLAGQLKDYFPDLSHPLFTSALAMVHQRFSTNTFPAWKLAHPYRMIAHNGEINTHRGNTNWMNAREGALVSDVYKNKVKNLFPVSYPGQSDAASFDNSLELLVMNGYSLTHAMAMLIPQEWTANKLMSPKLKAFYQHHATLVEPWDGPAAIIFCDGKQLGATLDRNGLRPARYVVQDDGYVVLASEAGVLPIDEKKIVVKNRLEPGKMLLIDFEKKKIVSDDEIKKEFENAQEYEKWIVEEQTLLSKLPKAKVSEKLVGKKLEVKQRCFGYTQEDIKLILTPMVTEMQEAIGSMGTDTPPSVLSRRPQLLYNYFKQNFAQVTNPSIDSIRERAGMSLLSFIGPRTNLLAAEEKYLLPQIIVEQPILTNQEMAKIKELKNGKIKNLKTKILDTTFDYKNNNMKTALSKLCKDAQNSVAKGNTILILSDRNGSQNRPAIPALLVIAAVHQHLIRTVQRTSVGLVVESAEPREVHHFATLAGFGAEAINPYLAFDTIDNLHKQKLLGKIKKPEIEQRYIKAISKGLLKTMGKIGISTYQSYCGAGMFDAVGLNNKFIEQHFTGTASHIEGAGIKEIENETIQRHKEAYDKHELEVGGNYAVRQRGELHAWRGESITHLQHGVRANSKEEYKKFAKSINDQSEDLLMIRGLFRLKNASERGKRKVPLEQVEKTVDIVKRFSSGAMSYGSISHEAHTTLAKAMNAIGGKSNTGEGGEDAKRFKDDRRSKIKQVASARFGVTADYLVNGDMLQIKIAQGAKPGEGGQLPGYKVDKTIARLRHSTPGVELISPPPHHDIYSIEDLAQLIYDLKNVNPKADVSVKLVSQVGVGTVAAGVAKAKADHVTISGTEGGTGAAALGSIKHTGLAWEIGLAETHQTLVGNKLRSRIAVQLDGGLRTGRDVVIAALLGADEFGFATAPLIAAGCIMMRKCHLNICPVGIATQDPVLRKRFVGTPEHIINYFFFVAEEIREYMSELGFKNFNEMIGQTDVIDQQKMKNHAKANKLDFSKLLFQEKIENNKEIYNSEGQKHEIFKTLNHKIAKDCEIAIKEKKSIKLKYKINNSNRSIGAMLSGEIARQHGANGMPEDAIQIKFNGVTGQSFAAFVIKGITLEVEGETNDYVAKGLCGGKIIVYPDRDAKKIVASESIIAGNTVLYGATAGKCYFAGTAGERFAVRNSGAIAVVEGVGNHGCEYMTGGIVVVLGETGLNYAQGMSGGISYILDENKNFKNKCNLENIELKKIKKEKKATKKQIENNLTQFDEQRLHSLISEHYKYTKSKKAKLILDDWQTYLKKFVKITPVEYRKAIERMQNG